jgi:4-amino-4-deoxy-L-arabinose transferase-like glycosyltransferase
MVGGFANSPLSSLRLARGFRAVAANRDLGRLSFAATFPQSTSSPGTPFVALPRPLFARFLEMPLLAEATLLATAAALFLYRLGADALRDWDEAVYAAVAREMLERRDWLSPSLGDVYYPNKPPLLYWLMAAFDGLFGAGELSSRLPTALFGLLGVVGVFLVGRRLHGRQTGLLAALVLATAPQWLRFSRQAMLDVPLSASLVFAMLGLLDSSWLLFGASMGAALLIKGPAAVVGLAAAALFAAFDLRGRAKTVAFGAALALLIATPWHVHQIVTHGRAFTDYYFDYSILERVSRPLEGHGARRSYYLVRIFTGTANPWHWVGAFALVAFTGRAIAHRFRRPEDLVVVWFWVPLAMLTVARTKLIWYIMPVYPALAIVTAAWLVKLAIGRPWVRRAVALLAFVTILQSAGSDLIHYGRLEDSEATRTVLAALPPPDRAPVLQVAVGIPAETARFYAHRPIDWCESASGCLGWLLVRADQVTYFGPRLTVAISGRRALLGPAAEEK